MAQPATKRTAEEALADQIKGARASAEAFIDRKAAELKQSQAGATLPLAWLRQQIMRGNCACAAALAVMDKK